MKALSVEANKDAAEQNTQQKSAYQYELRMRISYR
jgi:hypothetical protein